MTPRGTLDPTQGSVNPPFSWWAFCPLPPNKKKTGGDSTPSYFFLQRKWPHLALGMFKTNLYNFQKMLKNIEENGAGGPFPTPSRERFCHWTAAQFFREISFLANSHRLHNFSLGLFCGSLSSLLCSEIYNLKPAKASKIIFAIWNMSVFFFC